MKAAQLDLLPPEYTCKKCGQTKPIAEMIVVRIRRENVYQLRSRCKSCHNEKERGHRREWKRKYLQEWRRRNKAVNRSYWDNDIVREQTRIYSYRRFKEKHDAILIQGRMKRHGYPTTIQEAEELLKEYGHCYPTMAGLTPLGRKRFEQIRAAQRRLNSKRFTLFEIRMMVYDEGLYIKPSRQPKIYQKSAEKLREWHRKQRASA
ncbi:MAG TPA: hypothetical protein VEF04_05205 [Blastocatellia bacterium]|nr:hypothetical protein [Blastocatellia bacterium]